jgi:NAD(P)-dependent dehydrogenase (short-subunit alcohol dehydrogenase family)
MTRVAVVTGAAGAIGSATCLAFERNGWDVIAVDRAPIERVGALRLDVLDVEALTSTLGTVKRADALINNAAIQLFKPLADTTPDEWDEISAVNVRAAFVCVRALLPQLSAAGGAIVNVSSVHAHATSAGAAAYATSKGALMAFTRSAAVELAESSIRVNAVLPGAVESPALRAGLSRSPEARDTLIARTPLKRIGRPDEVAEAILFLADNDRSSFMTGQSLVVDGGALARLSTE